MGLQEHLTDLGNTFVASAAAVVLVGWLWVRLGWVSALAYLVCLLAVIGSVVGLKFIAYDLLPPVDRAPLFGLSEGAPSGHTAFATIVYGSLAVVLIAIDRRPRAWAAGAFCLAIIAAVAITRVTLDSHTVGDVVTGLMVAGIGVGVFARALTGLIPNRPVSAMAAFFAVVIVTGLLLASGVRFNTLAFL